MFAEANKKRAKNKICRLQQRYLFW